MALKIPSRAEVLALRTGMTPAEFHQHVEYGISTLGHLIRTDPDNRTWGMTLHNKSIAEEVSKAFDQDWIVKFHQGTGITCDIFVELKQFPTLRPGTLG